MSGLHARQTWENMISNVSRAKNKSARHKALAMNIFLLHRYARYGTLMSCNMWKFDLLHYQESTRQMTMVWIDTSSAILQIQERITKEW